MNIFDPLITGSLSVSGSGEISGDLTVLGKINATISGTTTNALTASEAPKYTLTSSFGEFTSSYTTGSFTGSFIGIFDGDGSRLTNIPASGVTGLNLTQIADGSVTASISSVDGLRVNTNTEITGALTISGSITLNGVPVGTGKLDEVVFNAYSSSNNTTNSLQNGRLGALEVSTSSLNTFTSSATSRLNTIESTTGSLNTFTSSTNSRLGVIESTTSSLNTFTSSANGRLNSLESASGSIRSDFSSYTSSNNTVNDAQNNRLNSIESTTGSLNTYTSSNNTRLGVIETTTGSLNSYTSSTNTRLGVIETTTGSLNTFTSSATSRLNSLESASGSIRSDFNSFTSSNNAVEVTQNGRLTSLETSTGSLNTYTSSNNTRLGVIEATTGSLNTYTSSNNTRLGIIESTTGSLNSYTSSNNANINAIHTATSSLNTFTSSTNTRLTSIETSTSSLNTFTSSANGRLSSLETASGSIRTDFNSYTSSNNTINTTQNGRLTSLENVTGSYATTGSNVFKGDQTITGSLFISQNLIVQGSSSLENITASAVSIGTNTIVLNTDSPAFRYAGISVFDSGSTNVTASLFYDSLTNQWKFKHSDVATSDASIVLFGPLGSDIDNTPLLESNYLTKVEGTNNHGHHLTTSSILDNGSKVSINSNSEITGSLTITGVIRSTTTPLVSGSSQIDHNSTTNYVANRHIDHTAVLITTLAGSGLTGGGDITTTRDLSIATGGVTNAMLAGSIENGKLSNSSLTIGTTAISLGGTSTTLGGLSSVTSTAFTGSLQGSISGNAATVTTNANLTGVVTSTGNVTTIANGNITNAMLSNSSFHVGTTSISLGRASASQTLTGVSIDGNATSETLATVTGRGASTSSTLNLDGRVNIGNSLTRPSALNSDAVAHARIGGSDVHLYVASLGAVGGYKVAVQAARTSDFASFDLDLQSNGGTLRYGGNEVATRTWVTSQNYLTSVPTHNQAWSTITSTPTTLGGYGISDAVSSVTSDFTTTASGWFRVATNTGDGRGTYYVEVYTTGGNYNPSIVRIYAHGDWGNDKLISVETDGGFPANAVRITRSSTTTFLELNFTTQILGASIRVTRLGFNSTPTPYSGSLPAGGDTVNDSLPIESKLNVQTASVTSRINIGNGTEVLGLIGMGASYRYGMGISGAFTSVYSHNSGNGVRLGFYDGTTFTARFTVPNIGAPTIDSNVIYHAGNIPTWNQNTSGNAATATILQTARTIGGVSFNGSANIDLPGVNTSGNQNTSGNAATATEVSRTVGAGSEANLLSATIAENDYFRLRVGGGSNAGFVEIATGDDGTEPIHVRQYTGVFSTLTRTATLLDGSGNTSFPGTVTAPTFSGALSGNASTVTNGVYTTGDQSIGGIKTFSDQMVLTKSGTQLKISRADTAAADWVFHSWASGLNIYPNAAGTVYFGRDGSATNVDVFNGILYQQGNPVWHSGNLTNLNQLTNGPGYITSETDTLATVTGRGASTSTAISINNTLTVTSGRVIARTGGVNTYGVFSGYDNNNHMMTFRAAVSGPTASPTFTAGHQTTFIEYAAADDISGWFFKSSSSTNYEDVVRITRVGITPGSNGTQNLGSSSARWNTLFTSDLSLSNGIGDYTIVEGEEKLYLYNNKNNKVYSFVLQEEDPTTATPKRPE